MLVEAYPTEYLVSMNGAFSRIKLRLFLVVNYNEKTYAQSEGK